MDNSQEWETVRKKRSPKRLMSSNSRECSSNNGTIGYDRGPDFRSDLNGMKDGNQSEKPKRVTRIQKAVNYEEMKKMDLSSYKIANFLTEAGYVVEEVCLSKRTGMCSIYTNCTEEASEMQFIEEWVKSGGYKLCAVELDDGRENAVQLMAGPEPTTTPTATFAVVIEEPHSANKRMEIAWCTSTLILEGKTNPHRHTPSQSEYIHFCLTTFHVLETILRDSAKKSSRGDGSSCCSNDDCDTVFKNEGQCSPDLMSRLIHHCNTLIASNEIFISLLKQNGQRIPVSSIIAADFDVAVSGNPTQDWISDGMLLKLESANVANFFATNAEDHLIQTSHNKQRSIRKYAGHEYLDEIGPTHASLAYIFNCQPLSFIDEDITTAYGKIDAASPKSPFWFKKRFTMTSDTRLPERGNSGSLLSLIEETSTHDALAIGSFHGRKYRSNPRSGNVDSYTECHYFFIPLKQQLAKLVNLYNNSKVGRENPLHLDSIVPYPRVIDYN